MSAGATTLVCPACERRHGADKRFCDSCGTPLTYLGADVVQGAVSATHERARKVDPRFTEGELVRVAGGRHQAEAEMIQGMLLEEGVPSVLRRSPGFDVPDFLAAGPRDVMVPEGGYQAAREVLLQADMAPQEGPAARARRRAPGAEADGGDHPRGRCRRPGRLGAGRVRCLTGRCAWPPSWRRGCGRCTSVRRRRSERSWWTVSGSPTWRTARWTAPSCAGFPTWACRGVQALVAPAMDGGGPIYWSDVVARPGEEATAIEQFAGRRLAVNEPDSHSGSNVVLATLAQRGVPEGRFTVVHTGSHAGSLAAVAAGEADVAAIDSHLHEALGADELTVIERLGPSPSQPLAAGPSLPEAERERIRAVLTALGPSEPGLTWVPVDDATYDPIRAMRAAAVERGAF